MTFIINVALITQNLIGKKIKLTFKIFTIMTMYFKRRGRTSSPSVLPVIPFFILFADYYYVAVGAIIFY